MELNELTQAALDEGYFIKEFRDIDEKIKQLYERRREVIQAAVQMQNVDKPMIEQNPDGTWTRVTVVDNVERAKVGYFEFVRVEPYSVKIEQLKNKPKELQ